ncbi:hypothetical protein Tco_0872622 [Tanacetum coccineum]
MKSVKKSIDERALHKREYDIWVNDRQMQTTKDKVDSSKALDARSIYDEEPMAAWWVPTGKIFTSSTTKVDSEPTNGSNEDITNQYECKQTLDVSAGTLNLSVAMTSDHNSSELRIHDHSNEPSSLKLVPKVVPPADKTTTSQQKLNLLFGPLYDEFFNAGGSSKLNLPDHRYKQRCCSLIPAESDSLPHAHTQTTKTYHKHQDSRIKKAQELKTKTSANSDIKDNSSETKLRGRLLESFQEDAKYEHAG